MACLARLYARLSRSASLAVVAAPVRARSRRSSHARGNGIDPHLSRVPGLGRRLSEDPSRRRRHRRGDRLGRGRRAGDLRRGADRRVGRLYVGHAGQGQSSDHQRADGDLGADRQLQHPRPQRAESQARRPDACGHLLGQDPVVGRSGDRGDQCGREAAAQRDRSDPSKRRFGRHVHLHPVSDVHHARRGSTAQGTARRSRGPRRRTPRPPTATPA